MTIMVDESIPLMTVDDVRNPDMRCKTCEAEIEPLKAITQHAEIASNPVLEMQ